jgi:hypothetical protein
LQKPQPSLLSGVRVTSEIGGVFDEDNSLGACLMYSSVKRYYVYAGHADAFFCLLQEIMDDSNLDIQPYDGEEHVIALDTSDSSLCESLEDCPVYNFVLKVNNLITTNDLGHVTYGKIYSFRASTCLESERMVSLYAALEEFDYTMAADGVITRGETEHAYSVDVSGTLKQEADFLNEKIVTITADAQYAGDNDVYDRLSETVSVTLLHLPEEIVDMPLRQGRGVRPRARGPVDDLVVDVREVLDVPDLVSLELQIAPHGIEDQVAHGVAHVGRRIRRDAADVHPHRLAIGGGERLLLAGEGAEDPHGVTRSMRATAWAETPSPRPSGPRPLALLALMLT